jgi:hypothetical protein
MSDSDLDPYIDAAAKALDLPLDAAWKPEIRANLALTLRLATFVASFDLPDDAEPAPIYGA